jgi:hypothetical protein
MHNTKHPAITCRLARALTDWFVQGYSSVCTLGNADLQSAPYRIENACTRYAICFRQKDNGVDWTRRKGYFCLAPGSEPHSFAWDAHVMLHRLAAVVLPAGVSQVAVLA